MTVQTACPRCSAPAPNGATACAACGYIRPPFGQQRRPMPVLTEQRAIAAMVCAVMGIVIPFVCGIAAVVLSLRARPAFVKDPGLGGRTLAAIGLWLGLVDIAGWTYVAIRIAT